MKLLRWLVLHLNMIQKALAQNIRPNLVEVLRSDKESFLSWVRFLKIGKAKETQASYELISAKWLNFLASLNVEALNATEEEALEYAESLKHEKGVQVASHTTFSPLTIKKYIIRLKALYDVGVQRGIINTNPFTYVLKSLPKGKQPPKKPIKVVSVSDFIKCFKTIPDTPIGIRNKAILAVLFGGALRITEALRVKMIDIKGSGEGTRYIFLPLTKNRKIANQVIAPDLVCYLDALVAQRLKEGAGSFDPLFPVYNKHTFEVTNRSPNRSVIQDIIERHCFKSEIKLFTSHSLRGASITKLLSEGLTYKEVQEFSRHSSVQMVEVYDKRRFGIDDSPGKKLNLFS